MKSLFLFYFFLLIAIADAAAAAGFGISPSSLGFGMEEGSESSRQLVLYSTGKQADFTITSSSKNVVVAPSSGVLPDNGRAVVTITARGRKAGTFREELAVRFYDKPGGIQVSIGLGMSVAVNMVVSKPAGAEASAAVGSLLSAGIVLSGVAAYAAAGRLRKAQTL